MLASSNTNAHASGIERELGIARDIQQALLPRGFRNFPHLDISAMNKPCLEVGGDYFDVFSIDDKRTAFLICRCIR